MRAREVVFLLSVMVPYSAHAGAKENAMHHFAQAMAAAEMCDRLEVNFELMAATGLLLGIDPTRDRAKLLADASDQLDKLKASSAEAACAAGIYLYGQDGRNVPGLLRLK